MTLCTALIFFLSASLTTRLTWFSYWYFLLHLHTFLFGLVRIIGLSPSSCKTAENVMYHEMLQTETKVRNKRKEWERERRKKYLEINVVANAWIRSRHESGKSKDITVGQLIKRCDHFLNMAKAFIRKPWNLLQFLLCCVDMKELNLMLRCEWI